MLVQNKKEFFLNSKNAAIDNFCLLSFAAAGGQKDSRHSIVKT